MNIVIIPARGGSKRIPRKNIREFCGKPIIAWSIESALTSKYVDRVIVSTDDEEIAQVALSFGADIPFLRPNFLSGDHVGNVSVIQHAINFIENSEVKLSNVCCLLATAPFVRASDIDQGYQLLESSDADFCFSVTDYPFPIQRAIRIREDGRVDMLEPDNFNVRSQDLEPTYHDAGQFYWGRKKAWHEGRLVFAPHSLPLHLPRYRVQDIDTLDDWKRAELMFEALSK